MEDLKALYFRIENPIDNKVKWSKLLNIYSTSYDYEDFYSHVIKKDDDSLVFYDNEDKKTFCLVMWSIWKSKMLALSEEELREFIDNKDFDFDVYDVIKKLRELESVKSYTALQQVLTNPDINRYFSELFDDFNHKVIVYSDFNLKKDSAYNTVLTIRVDSTKLYKLLKQLVNECIAQEIPYYIKYKETGKKIVLNIYTTVENFRKNESILSVLRKENNLYFYETKDLLAGNLNEYISLKSKDYFNTYQYLRERSLILFKSFDSVTYEYVVNHLNILVSYKDGRMNIIDYISTYVMERLVSQLISGSIKSSEEYINFTNSDDLAKLKLYIKEKLSNNMRDILKQRLYLKPSNESIPLKLNDSKTINIDVEIIMRAIRSLILTLMNKDRTLEKAYRIRIRNECQFYKVDYEKFCLDSGFSKKLFYNKEQYDKYRQEIDKIHDEIMKVESFENLISSEIDNETRAKIADSMTELKQLFELEGGN